MNNRALTTDRNEEEDDESLSVDINLNASDYHINLTVNEKRKCFELQVEKLDSAEIWEACFESNCKPSKNTSAFQ